MKHVNIPIFIPHLGCPYQCIYCNQRKIASAVVPKPSELKNIISQHLDTISPDTEVEVAFFGGNFTDIEPQLQEDYLREVEPFLASGRVKGIRLSTRPDSINEETLQHLKDRQVTTIELGVQSFSDEVLKASSRDYTAEVVFKNSNLIKQWGFKLGIQLMVGLPGDSYRFDIDSIMATIAIHPAMVRIYPTLVIADTVLETRYYQKDYTPLTLSEATVVCREMLLLLDEQKIPVIRMGLYPGDDLQADGVIVAGPFHPAFGELVQQSIFLQQAGLAVGHLWSQFGSQPELDIFVNPRDLSKMIGLKRQNISSLERQMNLQHVSVKSEPGIGRNDVGVGRSERSIEWVLSREAFLALRKTDD